MRAAWVNFQKGHTMPDFTGLYLRLPAGVQSLACSLEGWRTHHEGVFTQATFP